MGNASISCCRTKSPRSNISGCRNEQNAQYSNSNKSYGRKLSNSKNSGQQSGADQYQQHLSNNLQHISEREPDDSETDPSSNPLNKPIFAARSSWAKNRGNSYGNDSYSSSNNNPSARKLNNTLLTSSQDHGYNSGASTNLTQFDSQLNDSFESSATNITTNEQTNINQRIITGLHNQNDRSNIKSFDADSSRLLLLNSRPRDNITNHSAKLNNQSINYNTNGFQSNSNQLINLTNSSLTSRSGPKRSQIPKSSSCSTIFIDDSTISQPNLIQTIKCVSLAIYYHIKNRTSDSSVEIFDESIYPLKMPENNPAEHQHEDDIDIDEFTNSNTYDRNEQNFCDALVKPNQRTICRFVNTLFKSAQLTSEYAITTLVYLERLMTYAEMDLTPKTWRRMFLGAILLSSKVWEDQAVWNVDYAQILEEISVEDINELERQFLELIQFNMNVPSSVYAKYYFHLRTLSMKHGFSGKFSLLTVGKAKELEAMSRAHLTDWHLSPIHRKSSPAIKRHTSLEKLRLNGHAQAVLM